MPKKKDARLTRAGVSGYNKPKRTPKHPTKSHVVVAKEGDKIKLIRFGQQGKTGDRTGLCFIFIQKILHSYAQQRLLKWIG